MSTDIQSLLSELLLELETYESRFGSEPRVRDVKAKAKVAIANLGADRAISVWESLPEAKHTDSNGACWWWVPGPPSRWVLAKEESPESATATHWLPFDRLPQTSNFTG